MFSFRQPHPLPQDLLLIHDIVAQHNVTHNTLTNSPSIHDDVSSSGSEGEIPSEDEIEAALIGTAEPGEPSEIATSSDSDSDSDSDSESADLNSDRIQRSKITASNDIDVDDDDDAPAQSNTYVHTKNEVLNVAINIPDIQHVGSNEVLEKVGEIMSIVDNVVIVKGLPSKITNKGPDLALDSDTLLVFEDKQVLGYIYETFGPTSQPLYQVRFNNLFPLDPEKVRVSREVFHVPQRSNFVFLHEVRRLKGSDASNVHDEEPAEEELEFSDDEAEAVHRGKMKRRRASSRASSCQPSPSPSSTQDQELANTYIFSGSAYDAYGPYDVDFSIGSSRPLPMPYDDPYSDAYNSMDTQYSALSEKGALTMHNSRFSSADSENLIRGRSRHRGHERTEPRGRGRGRGRSRGRGGRISEGAVRSSKPDSYGQNLVRPYSPNDPHPFVPGTGLPDVHGNNPVAGSHASQYPFMQTSQLGTWSYPEPSTYYGTQGYQPVVQPHINPRFASAFGFNMYSTPSCPQYTSHTVQSGQTSDSTWAGDWTFRMDSSATADQPNETNNSVL